ncbi:EamA family transporter [Gordonia jinghuaiqii]|uniref:EamA family transporter n=2 Tax=Gordonia jinghuaiqii TaxID=2758710 RepID=A0A7D7R5Y8_9ACTN|nr:EamA family transporter [Gordonia jinghuaiqii]QMT03967.1 EamA family transporter [Gordonia jinghuaiqii]
MYLGAAVAVGLFDEISPVAVAWLRIAGAALVLLIWVRPPRAAWRPDRLRLAGSFGLITAGMNISFYEALAHLPLGTTVALEFLGPIVVAALGSRTRRDVAALALATVGVVLIADVRWSGTPLGVTLALTAAACWAGYIVLGKRVAARGAGVEDLATGFVVAALITSPLAWWVAEAVREGASLPVVLGQGLVLGLASTAVPYALDQIVLRRVGQARFALLLALLPVTASVIGLIALGQVPRPLEAVGIAAVALAVAVRSVDRDAEGSVDRDAEGSVDRDEQEIPPG